MVAAILTEMSNFPPTYLSYPHKTPAYPMYYYAIIIVQFEPDMVKEHRSQQIMHTRSSPFDGLQSTLIYRLHVLLVSVTNSSIKQCHIICMTSYAWQHISNTADYAILVAMALTHTHHKLA